MEINTSNFKTAGPWQLTMMFKTKEQMLNKCVYKSIK